MEESAGFEPTHARTTDISLVFKTSALPLGQLSVSEKWSGIPDSHWIRTGLQSVASSTSAYPTKMAGVIGFEPTK